MGIHDWERLSRTRRADSDDSLSLSLVWWLIKYIITIIGTITQYGFLVPNMSLHNALTYSWLKFATNSFFYLNRNNVNQN